MTRLGKRSKEEKERLAFDGFAKLCPLTFTHRESRPEPEPDILATLDTGEKIAFEVTTVDDGKLIKKENNDFDLNQLLLSMRPQLNNLDALKGYYIYVEFIEKSFRKQRNLLPEVIVRVNEHGSIRQYIKRGHRTVAIIGTFNHNSESPVHFGVGSGSLVGDYTIERIRIKLKKHYSTIFPIHLLAYGRCVWPENQWRTELLNIYQDQRLFVNIWVFSEGKNYLLDCSNPEWKPADADQNELH